MKLGVIKPKIIFAVHLLGQVHELIHISDVYQRDQIMGIQGYISTVAALMKQILRNQNHADISVMAASRKQITRFLGIHIVQHIV